MLDNPDTADNGGAFREAAVWPFRAANSTFRSRMKLGVASTQSSSRSARIHGPLGSTRRDKTSRGGDESRTSTRTLGSVR